ncbi:MAG TPA: GWxTD domain-containing protein [Vicingaceae bacterium]|nr:GWxTD domain-containing protein [Vicingaceae bacterium]
MSVFRFNNKALWILFIVFFTQINTGYSQNLKAYFTYCTFYSPESGPYIETYLSVVGNSINYQLNENKLYQGTIEITYLFKQGEEIKKFKKYNLLSPETEDTTNLANFIDQQRISLPNGNYEFEINIKDLNSTLPAFKSVQLLNVNYNDKKMAISDVEFVESLTKTTTKSIISKSGYDILPYTSDFYPENIEKIAFYAEIYNIDKYLGEGESYLLTYSIESYETNTIVGNLKGFTRETAKPVNILLKSFNIGNLASGNYNLVIEARDKSNELMIQKKVFFQRSNPSLVLDVANIDFDNTFVTAMDEKQLTEYIKCIEPISSAVELNYARNQLKGKDNELMQKYFYNFWHTRNALNPQEEWEKYKKEVEVVNKEFSTAIKKGYETDRGRVYLKHGKPNTIVEQKNEPSAYPYEIWHYYKVENFSNIRFVFYNPDLISNDYPILHSNLPGELNNPQWKVHLHKRTNQPVDMEQQNNNEHWGGRADDFYTNPR